jgi:hypothetical protein
VKFLRVFAQARSPLVVAHLGELPAQHGERDLARAHGRVYASRAEPGVPCRVEPAGVEPRLVFGEGSRAQVEGGLHLVHEVVQLRGRGRADLDLDTPQADRLPADGYLRGVERNLSGRTIELERVPLAAGPNLEQPPQVATADDLSRHRADEPLRFHQRGGSIVLQRLGDLTPFPETALGRVQGLDRRFDLVVRLAHTQGIAGPVETPVVCVVVGIRDPDRRVRRNREAGRTGGVPTEPTLDRLEIIGIELPLYLPMIRRRRLLCSRRFPTLLRYHSRPITPQQKRNLARTRIISNERNHKLTC